MAVFLFDGLPICLSYNVACDATWRTRTSRVRGWVGAKVIDIAISCDDSGVWRVDGSSVHGVEGLVDLDLGFTPATNIIPIRRFAPAVGEAVDAPAAWLDMSDWTLKRLSQRYERRGDLDYWYEAPGFGYAANLAVKHSGMVVQYPGLWEAETEILL